METYIFFVLLLLHFAEEEELSFAPTYRYEIGHRKEYAYKKVKKTGVGILNISCGDGGVEGGRAAFICSYILISDRTSKGVRLQEGQENRGRYIEHLMWGWGGGGRKRSFHSLLHIDMR